MPRRGFANIENVKIDNVCNPLPLCKNNTLNKVILACAIVENIETKIVLFKLSVKSKQHISKSYFSIFLNFAEPKVFVECRLPSPLIIKN